MKRLILCLSFSIFIFLSFAEDFEATTTNGKKVILHSNGTWEYKKEEAKITEFSSLHVAQDKRWVAEKDKYTEKYTGFFYLVSIKEVGKDYGLYLYFKTLTERDIFMPTAYIMQDSKRIKFDYLGVNCDAITIAYPEGYTFPDGIMADEELMFGLYFSKDEIDITKPFKVRLDTLGGSTWYTYNLKTPNPEKMELYYRDEVAE